MTGFENVRLAVIGAGPAGLAAAIEARKNGIEHIAILEREAEAGGILKQCIHTGFGLHLFGEELTGPEYAQRFISECEALKIPVFTRTMVLSLSGDKTVTAVNGDMGVFSFRPEAVILATGCRERPRGALMIPGDRPAGILTAGTAQKYVNIDGYLPGREVVILGSGDIGLIMARRLCLEGANVKAVLELMPYSAGLNRNIVQCLEDFNIPLYLNRTVVKIHGRERLCGVTAAYVDENRRPIKDTQEFIPCDTLLLSAGLIPENELAKNAGLEMNPALNSPVVDEALTTSVPGVYACGNALQVHDLVDNVTLEARRAGKSAAEYLKGRVQKPETAVRAVAGKGLRYVLPALVRRTDEDVVFSFRTDNVYCNASLLVADGAGNEVAKKRKIKMTPGEMEQVTVKKENLAHAAGELVFGILEEETC